MFPSRFLTYAIPIWHAPVSSATLAEVVLVSRSGENASAVAFAFCDDFVRRGAFDRAGAHRETGAADGIDVAECAAHLAAEVALRRAAIDGAHDEAAAGRGGFHRSWALTSLVDVLAPHVGSFVESGAYLGLTLAYVAARYPALSVFSCEPDPAHHAVAACYVNPWTDAAEGTRVQAHRTVALFPETSQAFLERMAARWV